MDTKKEETIVCPSCQRELPADSAFCHYCGNKTTLTRGGTKADVPPQKRTRFCSRCGGEVNADTAKCTQCGKQYFKKLRKMDIAIIAAIVLIIMVIIFAVVNAINNNAAHRAEEQASNPNNNSDNNSINNTNDTATKNWFLEQFNIAKNSYINTLATSKKSKNNQITQLQNQASTYYSAYLNECARIREYCAEMGLNNSGYQQSLLNEAEANYKSAVNGITAQIDVLENDIAKINKEINNPSVSNILSTLSQNCGISLQNAYTYYEAYISHN